MNIKDIPEFEGLYAVTKSGEIWSYPKVVEMKIRTGKLYKKHYKGHWMKLAYDKNGYLGVCIRKDKKEYHIKVHRAVALTYLPNPENLATVNHKNGVKTDNRISNLEWCSMDFNREHAQKNRLYAHGKDNAQTVLTDKQVSEIRELFKTNNFSQTQLGKMFKVSRSHISNIVNKKKRIP